MQEVYPIVSCVERVGGVTVVFKPLGEPGSEYVMDLGRFSGHCAVWVMKCFHGVRIDGLRRYGANELLEFVVFPVLLFLSGSFTHEFAQLAAATSLHSSGYCS